MDQTPVVTSEHSTTEETGRVLRFHARGVPRWRWPVVHAPDPGSPVDDLAKYEDGDSEDDYRVRMRMNALALVATVMLVFAGVWLAIRISEMVQVQDCFLSGRRNCAPIEIGPLERG